MDVPLNIVFRKLYIIFLLQNRILKMAKIMFLRYIKYLILMAYL